VGDFMMFGIVCMQKLLFFGQKFFCHFLGSKGQNNLHGSLKMVKNIILSHFHTWLHVFNRI